MKKLLSLLAILSVVLIARAETQAGSSSLAANGLPAVDHYVYLSELPESAELTKDAAANGLTVTRLDRTADRVVVSYRYPDGTTGTVGYALLNSVGGSDRPASYEPAPRTTRTVVEERTIVRDPEILYVEEPRYRRYYEPVDDFWLPLSLGIGLGWATTWHGGHNYYYHGGYQAGYRGNYHGGYRGSDRGGYRSGGRRR